ncbi:MAG: hypothetical protein Tsb002_36620 [Wenzhouxiangellaceae bacterium]
MENNALIEQKEKLLALALAKKGIQRSNQKKIVARERASQIPQSFAQQRLWFLDRLHPGTTAYNMPTAVRLRGPLDLELLQQSLRQLIQRHEILRTTFSEDDGLPLQIVADDMPFTIEVETLTDSAQDEQDTRIAEAVAAAANQPFDLTQGPLIRLKALVCGEQEHVLLLTLHHIIADGWSMGILLDELMALYAANRQQQPSPLSELAIQYGDFSEWQRDFLDEARIQQQLDYWSTHLNGVPSLDLPTDRRRDAVADQAAATQSLSLPAGLIKQLKALAQQRDVSLFMVCLAALNALLSRYSGQTDFAVGTPIWNRHYEELEPLIGFFVNTLAVRADVSGNPDFGQLLERVRDAVLGAYAHQDLPFERVVEALGGERSSGDIPLIRVMFSMHNAPAAAVSLPDLEIEELDSPLNTSKFELSLNLAEQADGGARLTLEYRSGLYDAESIERLLQHYQRLLEQVASDSSVAVAAIPLLAESEQQIVLEQWSQGATPNSRDGDALSWFEQQALQTPQALAASDASGQLNYAELDQRATQLAAYLAAQGVTAGDVVALVLPRSLDSLCAMLATLKLNAAYLPLDLQMPAERIAYILDDAQVSLALCHAAQAELLPESIKSLALDEAQADIAAAQTELPPRIADGQTLAYVIYTSGTSGQPKGVEVPLASLGNLIQWTQRAFDLRAGDRATQLAGAGFDAVVWETWPYLCAGASVHIVDDATRASASALVQWLGDESITHCFMPTPLAELCLQQSWPATGALRVLLTGGDVLHRRPPQGLNFTLYNNYGPTENTVVASWQEVAPGEDQQLLPSIGRPIDGVQLYVLDSAMQPVPPGVAGELYIGGASLASGYRGRPQLTEESFVANPFSDDAGARLYRSGDRVRYRASGELDFLGRVDEQVQIRGFRVEPAEIEAVLYQHAGIRRAAVVAQTDAAGDKYLVAHVEWQQSAAENELYELLKQRLPRYMLPAAIIATDELPLSASGKVDKAALPAVELAAANDEYVAPRNHREQMIAEIWADVMQLQRVGIHDNFFAIGGHSLLAMQIVARIEKVLDIVLPLQSLFDEPTVAGLAHGIESQRWSEDGFQPPPLLPQPRTVAAPEEGAPPPPDEYRFPQSASQQRLWFLEQLEPNSTTYSIPILLEVKGELDVAAMRQAFDALIERHEILRTTFAVEDNGALTQVIHKQRPMVMALTNLEKLPAEAQQAQAQQLVVQEAERPFNLTRGPLLRAMLLRLSAGHHILLLNMHHIITDAWSNSILISELSTLYRAFQQGEASPLQPLKVQYADFAKWQDEWLQFGVLEEMLFYWREKLRDAPPEITLMTDRPRQPREHVTGDMVQFSLSKATSEGLKQLASKLNATLFMVLLGGFKALLARHSGQNDIVIGVPVAARHPEELEPLIGFFVNTLVMRTDLSGDPGFDELIRRVRDTTVSAYEHQDLPFERLVEQLSPERRWQRAPMFQVMFVLQNAPAAQFDLPGLDVTRLPLPSSTAKFDLNLSMQEDAEGLHGALEYNTQIFDRATIERMLQHFTRLLESVLEQPTTKLTQLQLLPDDERQRMLQQWSRGPQSKVPAGDVCAWFEQQAQQQPQAPAIIDGQRQISYGELDQQANRLAHYLRRHGVERGSVVAIGLERSIEMVIGFMATLKAGGGYLPLDINNPRERLGYILENGAVTAMLTRKADCDAVPTDIGLCINLDDIAAELEAESDQSPARELNKDDLAYVIYTSGSTGKPKGVEVAHGALANLVTWQRRVFDVRADDRASQLAGAAFDASLCEWWVSLCVGGSVAIVDEQTRQSPQALIAWLQANEITIAFMPTPLLEASFDEQWPDDMKLRIMMTGGDALRRHPPAALKFDLYNIYGPAENAVATTYSVVPPQGSDPQPPTIGKPIDGVYVYVLDEAMQLVPAGVVGELYAGGDSLARGYRKQPELTAQRFIKDPFREDGSRLYRTGDHVRYRSDGQLEFLARADDQVKIRGYRIELQEIETALREQAAVQQAYVMAREDVAGDKRIVAYIVATAAAMTQTGEKLASAGGGESTMQPSQRQIEAELNEQLLTALRQRLPEYMLPSAMMFMEQLPKSASGKVDRAALPKPDKRQSAKNEVMIEPRNEVEEALSDIWGKILDYQPVSMNHNFFKNGGHSLLALSLKSEVHRIFGVNLDLAVLFENGTVENLAAHIAELQASGQYGDDELGEVWNFDAIQKADTNTGLMGRLKTLFRSRKEQQSDSKVATGDQVDVLDILVPIQPKGSRPPLFCVHPIGGGVLCYGELAGELGPDQPLFGLQAVDRDGDSKHSVETMASDYIRAIRSVQEQGPYALAGWSLGGVIAFEMARQLREAGETVNTLALLDGFLFDRDVFHENPDDLHLLSSFVSDLAAMHGVEDELEWQAPELSGQAKSDEQLAAEAEAAAAADEAGQTVVEAEILQDALDALKLAQVLPLEMELDDFRQRWLAYMDRYQVWSDYKAKPYAGKLSLIMAAEGGLEYQKTPLRGWGAVSMGGLTIDVLPGNHYSLLRAPVLQQTAAKLQELMVTQG